MDAWWVPPTGRAYSPVGGQYHGVADAGIGGQWRFSRAHLLAWLGGRSGQDDSEPPPRRPALDEEEVDVLLATLPDEPPTPAEQAARDDNDALGDR
jgi:hypothetical protein